MISQDYTPEPTTLQWLLGSDPSIRWQVMRDLLDETELEIAAERSRVATEGWGAKILSLQASNGTWGGAQEDLRLLITFNTLTVVKELGLNPGSEQARLMVERIKKNLVFEEFSNSPFFHGEVEPCINGRILGVGAYFNESNEALADLLLSEQLEDGGWNCEAPHSKCSSFHTTICVLEGLLEYQRQTKAKATEISQARERAETYLLERHLFRSLRTGETINQRWLQFSFPAFWHYDILRALDYFRSADFKPEDNRINEAVEIIMKSRLQDGYWPLHLIQPEYKVFEMETDIGKASRWNTLRALRVLRWYNHST